MESTIAWGDVATWVAGIGTVATFIVAFFQIHTERESRIKREKETHIRKMRDQAEHVSSWIAKVKDDPAQVWIAVSNQSTRPVYQVVLSLVMIQGNGPREGKEADATAHVLLSVAPPGVVFTSVAADYRGMHRHPGIEIAFKDADGKFWIRKADGDLVEINKPPTEYYDVDLPVSWQFGAMEIP